MVAHGTPCLGPVTHAGCGALCPSYDRGCYGCFGPMEAPEPGLARRLARRARPARARRRAPATAPSTPGAGVRRPRCAERAHHAVRGARARRGRGRAARARARRARRGRAAADLRAAALLRGVPARPRLHRGAGHHRAHLRHLPGRLPDELVRGDGGRVRRRRRRADPARCAGCCTAASGSRATRCTCSCCTRPTSSATTSAFDDGARPPRTSSSARCALKKAGNALMRVVGGREIHPVNVRVGGFYRAPTRARARRRGRAQLQAARELRAPRRSPGPPALPFPDFEEDFELRRAARRRTLRDRGRAGSSPAAGSTSRRTSTTTHFVEEQVPHSTALHSRLRDGGALPRRPARPLRAQPRPAAARGARRRPTPPASEPVVPQPVPQHRRARRRDPRTPSTRRCG